MAITKEYIREAFIRCKENPEHTHMLIVCDTFDWDDYPVEISKGRDIHEAVKYYSQNMQKVMEVYNMDLPMEPQLAQYRAFNY